MSRTLFFVGTDYGVGTSLIARSCARFFANASHSVGVFKPIEVNCPIIPTGEPIPGTSTILDEKTIQSLLKLSRLTNTGLPPTFADVPSSALKAIETETLCDAAKLSQNQHPFNLYRFPFDFPPYVAAQAARRPINPTIIQETQLTLTLAFSTLIIDGEGGLFSPIAENFNQLDLIKSSIADVVLVSRCTPSSLGPILLSIHVLQAHQIPLSGLILTQLTPEFRTEYASVPQFLETHHKDTLLGVFPFVSKEKINDYDYLASRFRVHLDTSPILPRV